MDLRALIVDDVPGLVDPAELARIFPAKFGGSKTRFGVISALVRNRIDSSFSSGAIDDGRVSVFTRQAFGSRGLPVCRLVVCGSK